MANDYSKGYYTLYKNSNNKEPYYWVLKAPNHEVILTSEMYTSKHGALNGIDSTRNHCEEDSNYQRLTASDNSPYFTLRAKNHEVIGVSEMYSSEQAREKGIAAVKKYGKNAPLFDETASGGEFGEASNSKNYEKPIKNERPQKAVNAGRYA